MWLNVLECGEKFDWCGGSVGKCVGVWAEMRRDVEKCVGVWRSVGRSVGK